MSHLLPPARPEGHHGERLPGVTNYELNYCDADYDDLGYDDGFVGMLLIVEDPKETAMIAVIIVD